MFCTDQIGPLDRNLRALTAGVGGASRRCAEHMPRDIAKGKPAILRQGWPDRIIQT